MVSKDELDFRSDAEKAYDTIEALARIGRVKSNARIRNALRVIAANPGDIKTVQEVLGESYRYLTTLPTFKRAMRDRNPLGPCPGSIVSGPIVLGNVCDVVTRKRFTAGLHDHEFSQGVLVWGRSGGGKTNESYCVLGQLIERRIPFWAFDFKRDYRHLLRKTNRIVIFNNQNLRLNSLRAPRNCNPALWLQMQTEIFCDAFMSAGAPASKNVLLQSLDQLYREHGVYQGCLLYTSRCV